MTDRDRRGAQVFATDLACGLEDLGARCTVYALEPGAHDTPLPVDGVGTSRRAWSTGRAVRSLARRHDVVVAHGSTTLFVASVALAATPIPFVYRQISDPLHWASSANRRARVAVMIRRAGRVVALSDASADVLRRHYRLRRDTITVIPNAVPAARFPGRGRGIARSVRESVGWGDGSLRVLSVGALVEEKGVDMAIRAVAELAGSELLVIGDGERRADLESLARQVAPDRVRFAGSTTRPSEAYETADVCVFPSRGGDSVPATLIEAGLCELPVVTTPVGSITDVVVDRLTGLVVPIGDQRALDAAIGELATDAELRSTLGRAGRQRCLDHFTIEATAPRWLELLTELSRACRDRAR